MLRNMRKMRNPTHAQELVTLRTGRPVAELLHDLYVTERRSQASIAEELGVTRLTVAMWLREFDIRRPEAVA